MFNDENNSSKIIYQMVFWSESECRLQMYVSSFPRQCRSLQQVILQNLTHRHLESRARPPIVHVTGAQSPGRGQILHTERAALIRGQVTDAGHQANVSLFSGVNKPEFPRKLCPYFSEAAITKVSLVRQLCPWFFKNVPMQRVTTLLSKKL